ncbi:MAG: hypothetical protein U0836_16130 [Pirellulales bacterium]
MYLIAAATNRSREEVVGLLVGFWLWASGETADGKLPGLSCHALVTVVGATEDFWRAVVRAGWLVEGDGFLRIPRADHWLTKGAKARLQAALRKQKQRAGLSRSRVTKTGLEKRREEKSIKSTRAKSISEIRITDSGRWQALRERLVAAVDPQPEERDVLAMLAGLVSEGHLAEAAAALAVDDLASRGGRVRNRLAYFWACVKARAGEVDVNSLMRRVRLPGAATAGLDGDLAAVLERTLRSAPALPREDA